MARRKKIYEGKAKILYEGPEPGTIVQYFKDDATAFNAEKKAVIEGKGVLNNRLSEFFMRGLAEIGVPTLIVVGEADIPDVHAHAGVIDNAISDSRRVILNHSGHLAHLEVPDEFNALVLAFLDSAK